MHTNPSSSLPSITPTKKKTIFMMNNQAHNKNDTMRERERERAWLSLHAIFASVVRVWLQFVLCPYIQTKRDKERSRIVWTFFLKCLFQPSRVYELFSLGWNPFYFYFFFFFFFWKITTYPYVIWPKFNLLTCGWNLTLYPTKVE